MESPLSIHFFRISVASQIYFDEVDTLPHEWQLDSRSTNSVKSVWICNFVMIMQISGTIFNFAMNFLVWSDIWHKWIDLIVHTKLTTNQFYTQIVIFLPFSRYFYSFAFFCFFYFQLFRIWNQYFLNEIKFFAFFCQSFFLTFLISINSRVELLNGILRKQLQ